MWNDTSFDKWWGISLMNPFVPVNSFWCQNQNVPGTYRNDAMKEEFVRAYKFFFDVLRRGVAVGLCLLSPSRRKGYIY